MGTHRMFYLSVLALMLFYVLHLLCFDFVRRISLDLRSFVCGSRVDR